MHKAVAQQRPPPAPCPTELPHQQFTRCLCGTIEAKVEQRWSKGTARARLGTKVLVAMCGPGDRWVEVHTFMPHVCGIIEGAKVVAFVLLGVKNTPHQVWSKGKGKGGCMAINACEHCGWGVECDI